MQDGAAFAALGRRVQATVGRALDGGDAALAGWAARSAWPPRAWPR